MTTKTLYVCGDSYASLDTRYPNTHFSELLANELNCNLVSLSRAGISNAAIHLQIERAIDSAADFIIYVATDSYRFEVPLNTLYPTLSTRTYTPSNGIDNIDYSHQNTPAENNVDFALASLYSIHYSKFSEETSFPKEFTSAWKSYFTHIYSEEWKKQTDQWIIENCLNRLIDSGIPFLFIPNDIDIKAPGRLKPSDTYYRSLTVLGDENPSDATYHTDANAQTIIATEIKELICHTL